MKRKDALYELLIQHAGTRNQPSSRLESHSDTPNRIECADSIAPEKGLLYSSRCRFAHRCCCAATLENAVSGASAIYTHHNQLHKYRL